MIPYLIFSVPLFHQQNKSNNNNSAITFISLTQVIIYIDEGLLYAAYKSKILSIVAFSNSITLLTLEIPWFMKIHYLAFHDYAICQNHLSSSILEKLTLKKKHTKPFLYQKYAYDGIYLLLNNY